MALCSMDILIILIPMFHEHGIIFSFVFVFFNDNELMKVKVLLAQLCLTLCDPMDCSLPAPLSLEFSRQEYWSGLPFLSPGDLPDTGIEPRSPTLRADSLWSEPPGNFSEGL